MRAVNRRIRQRKGSANLARVKGHTMAMAYEVQQRALAAESEWEARVRADERERNREADGVEAYLRSEVEAELDQCRADLSDCRHWAKEGVLELAHAEAVAARLVEVIVEMQSDIDHAWAVANGDARR